MRPAITKKANKDEHQNQRTITKNLNTSKIYVQFKEKQP